PRIRLRARRAVVTPGLIRLRPDEGIAGPVRSATPLLEEGDDVGQRRPRTEDAGHAHFQELPRAQARVGYARPSSEVLYGMSSTFLRQASICRRVTSESTPKVRSMRAWSRVRTFVQAATQTLLSPEEASCTGSISTSVPGMPWRVPVICTRMVSSRSPL